MGRVIMHIEPCINLQLRQADRILTSHYNAHLSGLGLKITQFSVLRALWFMKTSSQQDLEKVLLVDQATLTRSLKPLIREGYIDRVADSADRRVMLCSLSKEGAALYKQAEECWQQAQDSVQKKLGPDMIEQLLGAAKALIDLKS
jgi:DNA-binding MarR family transcriptional regulator